MDDLPDIKAILEYYVVGDMTEFVTSEIDLGGIKRTILIAKDSLEKKSVSLSK